MFTSYGHINKPKWNHRFLYDFRPGHVHLSAAFFIWNWHWWRNDNYLNNVRHRRHNRCFIEDLNAFAHTERLKGHYFYYLFKKHELIDRLIDWLVTDLSGMSAMHYIHIDLNVIFGFNLNCLFSQNHHIRFVNTSDSSHFIPVDKKLLFNGIIGWCILIVIRHKSNRQLYCSAKPVN